MAVPHHGPTLVDLIAACGRAGCPVCRLALDGAFDALDALLYEHVTDPESRERLRASWGLCPEHARMLCTVENAASGTSILYEDFVGRAERRLAEAAREAARRGPARGLRRLLGPEERGALVARTRPCPGCEAGRAVEARALRSLLDHLGDARRARAYRRSAGLCLPHLERAWVDDAGHARLGDLLRDAAERARCLREELAEYIRKLDYRFGREPMGDEGRAWLRAIEWFAGSRPEPEARASRLARPVTREPDRGGAG